MIFQNNIIKEYLKNVYFITGTPCGGKTTISRTLAKKYNLLVYDVDERFERNENSTIEETVKKVEHFFGFDAIKNEVKIEKLQNNSKLWSQTIDYAKDCTWSVGKHLAELLREGVFQDYECVFAALSAIKS